jgi:hypothetical protein
LDWYTHDDRRSLPGISRYFDVTTKDCRTFTHSKQPQCLALTERRGRNSNAVVLNLQHDHPITHVKIDPEPLRLRMASYIRQYFLKNAKNRRRLFSAQVQILFDDVERAQNT